MKEEEQIEIEEIEMGAGKAGRWKIMLANGYIIAVFRDGVMQKFANVKQI